MPQRLAKKVDVEAGRAAFVLKAHKKNSPLELELPACGIVNDKEAGQKIPVVVIQAEHADGTNLYGFRFLWGGNGICTANEIELIGKPTKKFQALAAKIKSPKDAVNLDIRPLDKKIDKIIRSAKLDKAPLKDITYDEVTGTWVTAVAMPIGKREVGFEVEFQVVKGQDTETEYLVVGWVVLPPDELDKRILKNLSAFQVLNDLNSDVGAKFRLNYHSDDEVALMCEVDLPVHSLTVPDLTAALERSRDLVASYFGDLKTIFRGGRAKAR